MQNINHLKGIIAPLISPCNDSDELDFDKLLQNLERICAANVNGLYLCGGTGDGERLRLSERKLIAQAAIPRLKELGKVSIVHIGQTFMRGALELTKQAAELGANAVASIPPRTSWDLIIEYYREIAKVGLPVIVYYIPQVTGITADFEMLAALLSIDGVVGIKMTDWNIFMLHRLKLHFPEKLFYSGYDELIMPALLYGADGCIGTWMNLLPSFYVKQYALINSGELHKAELLQSKFLAFLDAAWENDVINSFEQLMSAKGYSEFCFRKPFSRPEIPKDKLNDMLTRLDDILAAVQQLN